MSDNDTKNDTSNGNGNDMIQHATPPSTTTTIDREPSFTGRHGGLLMAVAMGLGLLLLIALNMHG